MRGSRQHHPPLATIIRPSPPSPRDVVENARRHAPSDGWRSREVNNGSCECSGGAVRFPTMHFSIPRECRWDGQGGSDWELGVLHGDGPGPSIMVRVSCICVVFCSHFMVCGSILMFEMLRSRTFLAIPIYIYSRRFSSHPVVVIKSLKSVLSFNKFSHNSV